MLFHSNRRCHNTPTFYGTEGFHHHIMVPLQYFLQCSVFRLRRRGTVVPSIAHVVVERLLGCSPGAGKRFRVRSVADVLFDTGIACCVQGGDEQSRRAIARRLEWVDVDAVDAVECFVDQFASAGARRVLLPSFVQTERSEGNANRPQVGSITVKLRAIGQGGFEGLVEDELFRRTLGSVPAVQVLLAAYSERSW